MMEGKILAEAHWKWLQEIIKHLNLLGWQFELVAYIYRSAFEHGYKHGVEDTTVPRSFDGRFKKREAKG